ncbi:MAG: ACT domain-containing protein [Candidatus Bathyarchaeia archaeon]
MRAKASKRQAVEMRMVEILKLDTKGRVSLPAKLRDGLGLREGMYIMAIADLETRNVRLTPFADPEARLIQLRIGLADMPGSLARVAKVLAEANIDLLSTESATLERGQRAEWRAVADASKCPIPLNELKSLILKDGAAKTVEVQELR